MNATTRWRTAAAVSLMAACAAVVHATSAPTASCSRRCRGWRSMAPACCPEGGAVPPPRPRTSSTRRPHVTPSGVSEHFLKLPGSPQSPCPVPLPTSLSNQGPFPPSALPGFLSTMGLSATPTGPACPSRASGWRVPRRRRGFPCCAPLPLPCVPPPLPSELAQRAEPRRNRSVPASLASLPMAAFPGIQAGRLPRCWFRGLLGVHICCGPHGR